MLSSRLHDRRWFDLAREMRWYNEAFDLARTGRNVENMMTEVRL